MKNVCNDGFVREIRINKDVLEIFRLENIIWVVENKRNFILNKVDMKIYNWGCFVIYICIINCI